MQTLLSLRNAETDLFTYGDYQPLAEADDRLIAFARRHKDKMAVIAVCRDPSSFVDGSKWPDFSSLQDVLPSQELRPALIFGELPVAVLHS